MRFKSLLIAVLSVFALSALSTASMAAYDITNGGMDTFTSGVADNWTAVRYRTDANSPYTASSSDRDGTTGSSSQRLYCSITGSGAYAGIYQQIDAAIGDAITVSAWGGGAVNASTSAYLGVDLTGAAIANGAATLPATMSSTFMTAKNWAQRSYAGVAAGDKVTVFLYGLRTANAGKTAQYINFDDVVSYHAYKPLALTVGNATADSLTIDVNAGLNNANAEYAIKVGTGWLQSDGSVGVGETWLTDALWGTKTVTGLQSLTEYTFQAKARYDSTWTQATSLGDIATLTTAESQAAVPEPGSILAACSILAPAGLAFKRRRK